MFSYCTANDDQEYTIFIGADRMKDIAGENNCLALLKRYLFSFRRKREISVETGDYSSGRRRMFTQ